MISLRALEPADIDVLYELENEQSLWPSSNTHTPYSRFTLEQFILSTQNDLYLDRQLRLVAVEEQEDSLENTSGKNKQTVVGIVDLCNFNPQHNRAEVSIAILKEHRHKGLGKDTLSALIDFTRQNLRIHQLYAIVSVGNTTAQQTFKAAGFKLSATMRDWISSDRDSWTDAQLWQLIF